MHSRGVAGEVRRSQHHDVGRVVRPIVCSGEQVDLHVLVAAVAEPAAGVAHLDEAGLRARPARRVAGAEARVRRRAQQPLQAPDGRRDEVVVQDDLDGDLAAGARPAERVGDVGTVEAVGRHSDRAAVRRGVDGLQHVVGDPVLGGHAAGRVVEQHAAPPGRGRPRQPGRPSGVRRPASVLGRACRRSPERCAEHRGGHRCRDAEDHRSHQQIGSHPDHPIPLTGASCPVDRQSRRGRSPGTGLGSRRPREGSDAPGWAVSVDDPCRPRGVPGSWGPGADRDSRLSASGTTAGPGTRPSS